MTKYVPLNKYALAIQAEGAAAAAVSMMLGKSGVSTTTASSKQTRLQHDLTFTFAKHLAGFVM